MPVLADLTIGGQPRKVVLFANRNGFFYVLDRATGKLIRAKPFIETSWAKEIRADGRPMLLPEQRPERGGHASLSRSDWRHQLDAAVVRSRRSVSFSSRRANRAASSTRGRTTTTPATAFAAAPCSARRVSPACLRAIDVATGERRWEFPYATQSWAGVLSTASGLVFAGSSGNFMAFDAQYREEPLALSDRLAAVRGRDHLHGRRPPIRADAVRHDADGLCAARSVELIRTFTGLIAVMIRCRRQHASGAGPAAARPSGGHSPRKDLYAAFDPGAQHGHARRTRRPRSRRTRSSATSTTWGRGR